MALDLADSMEDHHTPAFVGLEHPRRIDFECEPAHALTIALRSTYLITKNVDAMVERVNTELTQNIGLLTTLLQEFQAETRSYAEQIDHDAKSRLANAAKEIIDLSQAECIRRVDLIAAEAIDSITQAATLEVIAAVRSAMRVEEDQLRLQKRRYDESLIRFDSALAQLINSRQSQVNKGFFRKLWEVFFTAKPLPAMIQRRDPDSGDHRQPSCGAAK